MTDDPTPASERYARPALDAAETALRNRYGRTGGPPRHTAEIALTAAAAVIEKMCHWTRGARVNQLGEDVSHEEFHYDGVCPYEAMSAVLQGLDDPRPGL